jgi:xylose isomerase
MRTYLILKETAKRWNADPEIQAIVREAHQPTGATPDVTSYSAAGRDALLATPFDRRTMAAKGLQYERLDQLTMEVLLGVR